MSEGAAGGDEAMKRERESCQPTQRNYKVDHWRVVEAAAIYIKPAYAAVLATLTATNRFQPSHRITGVQDADMVKNVFGLEIGSHMQPVRWQQGL